MANRIAYWRRERGLTQEVLSMAANIPRHRLGLIERQFTEPETDELRALSKILKVRPSQLLSKKENQTKFELGGEF